MNSTEEFIYKGYYEGLSKHDKAVHILKSESNSTPYYMFKLDKDVEVGSRLLVSYNHTFAYRKGQFLVGGVCHE